MCGTVYHEKTMKIFIFSDEINQIRELQRK